MAESGADIVREIGDVAQACTLSIRSYTWLLPRVVTTTRTTDHGTVRSHLHEMLRRATDYPFPYQSFWGRSAIAKTAFLTMSVILGVITTALGVVRVARGNGLHGKNAVLPELNPMGEELYPPKIDLGTLDTKANWDMIRTWNRRSHPDGSWTQRAIFCKNVSFIPSIVDGRVVLNDAGIARSDGATVHFTDDQSAEFDTIVLCTGFTKETLAIGDLEVKEANVRNLYKHFLHPEHDGTAAFIGFVRPFSGGIPIVAEMQARYFARVLAGKLTPPRNIDEVIGREKEWEEYQLGKAALADVYSEPVENRREMALRMSLLQLMPSRVHPRDIM